MRYIKLFEGFDPNEWNRVEQNINDMLVELKDIGLLYDVYYSQSDKSLMSRSGETRITIIVIKNTDIISDDYEDYDGDLAWRNRGQFDLSDAYEPVAFAVDYLKDKYGRYERYLVSRVDGFNVRYYYTTPKPEFGPARRVELGNYDIGNLDKLNVRVHNRQKFIGTSFTIEIKIWD